MLSLLFCLRLLLFCHSCPLSQDLDLRNSIVFFYCKPSALLSLCFLLSCSSLISFVILTVGFSLELSPIPNLYSFLMFSNPVTFCFLELAFAFTTFIFKLFTLNVFYLQHSYMTVFHMYMPCLFLLFCPCILSLMT